jgi:hypothetical protein
VPNLDIAQSFRHFLPEVKIGLPAQYLEVLKLLRELKDSLSLGHDQVLHKIAATHPPCLFLLPIYHFQQLRVNHLPHDRHLLARVV